MNLTGAHHVDQVRQDGASGGDMKALIDTAIKAGDHVGDRRTALAQLGENLTLAGQTVLAIGLNERFDLGDRRSVSGP